MRMFNRKYKYYSAFLFLGITSFFLLLLNSNPLPLNNNSKTNLISGQCQSSIQVNIKHHTYSEVTRHSVRLSILGSRASVRSGKHGRNGKPYIVRTNLLIGNYKNSNLREFSHSKQTDKTNHEVFLI